MWKIIYHFVKQVKNIIVFILFALFAFSILANFISPQQAIIFAPFGLLFLPLFFITFIIGVIYIKRNKWIALTAFFLIALSIQFFANILSFNLIREEKGLKVMSWNVKNFDLYNWTKNQKTRESIFSTIDSIKPDILCLQEFYTDSNDHNNIAELKKRGYPYYCFFPAHKKKDGRKWGLAIFSKYELKKSKAISLNSEKLSLNQCARSEVLFKGKSYHIYNAHLQSIHLDYEDLNYIEGVKNEWSIMDKFKSWKILYKIITAYKSRIQQVEKLLIQLENHDNIILCCDLNDIPSSYAYYKLSHQLKDAFKEKGIGLSNTISVGLPIYRIDYIFTSPSIVINHYQRLESTLSDHHFIVAHLQ